MICRKQYIITNLKNKPVPGGSENFFIRVLVKESVSNFIRFTVEGMNSRVKFRISS